MTIGDLLDLHDQTFNTCYEIMKAKNHDYTSGSSDPFANFKSVEILGIKPEIGLLVRVLDKIKRIKTFVEKGTLAVENEGVDDAIDDIINYMILLKGMIYEKGESIPTEMELNFGDIVPLDEATGLDGEWYNTRERTLG